LAEVLDVVGNEMVLNDIIFEEKIGNISRVYGNKKYIQEILFNIIENAIHSIGRLGKITISAEERQSSVRISIKDSGRGISEENIKHIFEPFFTTKMDEKGVGLGLYVIKQLMLRMDGNIEVESKPGEGATFKLDLKKA
jgi:signal transduction histidine kinase